MGDARSALLLAASGTIVPLLLAEGVLRALPSGPRRHAAADRPKTYYLPADSPSTRGNRPGRPAGDDVFDLAIVGDSFTFGPRLQWDDTFVARLERLLNLNVPDGGRAARVIGFGTPGASSADEARTVSRAADEGVDSLLLQITLNDPQERPFRKVPAGFDPETAGGPAAGVVRTAARYSRLVRFVRDRVFAARTVTRYVDYHHGLYSGESWDRFRRAADDAAAACAAKGVKFGAVLFPLFDFPVDDGYPFAELHRKIGDHFRERGVPFLDLKGVYEGADVGRLVTVPGADSHPNEIAHRMAAEAILPWLRKAGLAPARLLPRRRLRDRSGYYPFPAPGPRPSRNL